ncbi:unnamed protein product [Protopolystoma xenopodis]|uniref:Uncharacterized protein n=1 Tax=Protopolystoma xenopodis TaxID=117903 RepID=A0A448W9V1_9PLAT|nr:unnamed protein product [Protopolystoma xenopodis]
MIISRVRLWTWYISRRFAGIVSESCHSQHKATPRQRDRLSQSLDQLSVETVVPSLLVLTWSAVHFMPSCLALVRSQVPTCSYSTRGVPFWRIQWPCSPPFRVADPIRASCPDPPHGPWDPFLILLVGRLHSVPAPLYFYSISHFLSIQ